MAVAIRNAEQIIADYAAARPRSAALAERAGGVLAGGVEHDMRISIPFPVYIERAEGAHKWDVDGHRYIDYIVGHGALLLGHNHPAILGPVREQLARGTHFGASHEQVIGWGERVLDLVPSAEFVRFLSSGTEATMMAMRMCRAVTGRDKVLKFQGHFHGWHEYAIVAYEEPFAIPTSAGVPQAVRDQVLAIPVNDEDLLADTLGSRDDIAGVILEPSGGSWGWRPTELSWVRRLRELTAAHQIPLIFDEVVTGFRFGPGGYQGEFGIVPDLTTMAKIMAGGFPGAAVAGQARFLERLEYRGDSVWDRGQRIAHPGTYNGNPLSATAGAAVLEYIADGKVHAKINRLGDRLRDGIDAAFAEAGVPGGSYGSHSFFHITFNGEYGSAGTGPSKLFGCLMLENGVHIGSHGGMLSAALDDADIDATVDAVRASLEGLKRAGQLD